MSNPYRDEAKVTRVKCEECGGTKHVVLREQINVCSECLLSFLGRWPFLQALGEDDFVGDLMTLDGPKLIYVQDLWPEVIR